MFQPLWRLLRHAWLDEDDTRRAIPPELLDRLMRRVAASERRHGGEIRICVEASLPLAALWRQGRDPQALRALVRARALDLFAQLRVWDTEHNNGVLIYLLLGEHAIEIVADRGLNPHVSTQHWQAMVGQMGEAFRAGRFEDGLTQALEEVSAVLVRHFPDDAAAPSGDRNELPDEPVLR
ncbi:TPM domain-containing protein [Ramlibacter sp. 2FC]|uniref:TPM domain-containing protein n=1 Tax=Ramlibacter sp. 2FC TaxID=2502188 RepID=UPI0010F99CB1|nr:TPM domain-containing protein [Ramlibacter sp. 2FC]